MLPLNLAPLGEKKMIAAVGSTQDLKHHLHDLGFIVGTPVRLIQVLHGSVIVELVDTRIALDAQLARRPLLMRRSVEKI